MRPAALADTEPVLVDATTGDSSAATVLQPDRSAEVPMQNSTVVSRLPGLTVPFNVALVEATEVELVVMATGSSTVTIENVRVADSLVASVTWTVNDDVPGKDGMPEIAPVVAFNERPGGREPPATSQTYGATPPSADRVFE